MLFLSQFAIIQSMEVTHLIRGKVIHGNKRGKTLGFPTANINLHKDIIEGVYLSEVVIENGHFFALTFIGAAKTFNEKKKMAESYILNFNKELYGEWITIRLFRKIRGNIKFKSEKELTLQMQKDLLIAKDFLLMLK
jgi:riboflavin kinase/FMN adenylyltransferase